MAEDKKKDAGSDKAITAFEIIAGVIIFFFILNRLGNFFSAHFGGDRAAGVGGIGLFFSIIGHTLANWFGGVFPTIELLAIFCSVLFFMGIIYALFRLKYVEKARHAKKEKAQYLSKTAEDLPAGNIKWQRVLNHVNSDNPSDWRLAILEGDILLSDLLESMGYRGEGIGDMLKSVEQSDFSTIDSAWEAHKIRNAIAHEGADFLLSQREAKRIIGLYESVFQEFRFI